MTSLASKDIAKILVDLNLVVVRYSNTTTTPQGRGFDNCEGEHQTTKSVSSSTLTAMRYYAIALQLMR